MLKQLKSFLKILWAYIWPTAELGSVNYMKTPEEYYGLSKSRNTRGNLVWEQEGIKFVPDKKGKYTKQLIGDCTHYVRYIPEFDDNYVSGCDPIPQNNKSKGVCHYEYWDKDGYHSFDVPTVNLSKKELDEEFIIRERVTKGILERTIQMLKATIYIRQYNEWECSEQSVILHKMDEISAL